MEGGCGHEARHAPFLCEPEAALKSKAGGTVRRLSERSRSRDYGLQPGVEPHDW